MHAVDPSRVPRSSLLVLSCAFPLDRLLSGAHGVAARVDADPRGSWLTVCVGSSHAGGGVVTACVDSAGRASVMAQAAALGGDADDLRAHVEALQALGRAADLLRLVARLPPDAVAAALGCRLAADVACRDDEELVGRAVRGALACDLEADGVEAFVDLALAARELRQLALAREAGLVAEAVELASVAEVSP